MDGNHFDALLRSFSETPSRRTALRLLVGSALGGLLPLGTISTDAKKGGKGNGKGQGKKGKGKKVAICHNGQTIRVAKPVAKVLLKLGDRKGPCAPPSTTPNLSPGPTCSPPCPVGMRCAGTQCVVGQGTCPTGANTCGAGADFVGCGLQEAGDSCQCLISAEGQTRCANGAAIDGGSVCGECASSAECAALHPTVVGVFCVRVTGTPGECCDLEGRGLCLAPCPTPPACATAEDCPRDTLEVCEVATCNNGRCGKTLADEGIPSSPERQTSGDCRVMVCDGNGDDRSEEDNTDLPNPTECTVASCDNGAPVREPSGTPCSGGECDGAGHCVPAP
jgi:hypothetical protein